MNLVCIVGVLALLGSAVGHIVEHSHWLMMVAKVVMILGAVFLLFLCNKFNMHKFGRGLAIIAFCDFLFPVVFFANGGSNGGMAAYFVLTMVLIVLLSKGRLFFVFMGIHLVIVIGCYFVDRYFNRFILQLDTFQHYADNVISIVVSGIFIGLVIKGVSALFMQEQAKAEAASNLNRRTTAHPGALAARDWDWRSASSSWN